MGMKIENAVNNPSYDTTEPINVVTSKKETGNVPITNSVGVQPKDTGAPSGPAHMERTGKTGGY